MQISVVISTYGGEQWSKLALERALPSTDKQGFEEVILSHLPNGTLAQARNEGAAQAENDWLLFLDADDELAPGFGDAMRAHGDPLYRTLFTPAVQYVRGVQRPAPKIWPRVDFKVGNWCVIGTLVNKTFFHELGGFQEWPLYEDYALWAKADVQGAKVVEVPEAVYVAHSQAKSRNRAPDRNEKIYWHQRIGHAIWPDYYDMTTAEEDAHRKVIGGRLRFI